MAEYLQAQQSQQDERASLTELAAFIGHPTCPKEWEAYRDQRSSHAGFDGCAALFGAQWFIARRLYWHCLCAAGAEIAIPLLGYSIIVDLLGNEGYENHRTPVHVAVAVLFLVVRIALGYWANLVLYKKATRVIREIDQLNFDNEMHLKLIANAGRINVLGLVVIYLFMAMLKMLLEV